MPVLELDGETHEAHEQRTASEDERAARVDCVLRGLLRHRAKRSGTAAAMEVDELDRLRRVLGLVAGARGRGLGAAAAMATTPAGTLRPAPLRVAIVSGMDGVASNHYLRHIA